MLPVCLALAGGCSTGDSQDFSLASGNGSSSSGTYQAPVGGDVKKLSVTDGVAKIDVGALEEGKDIVLVVYAFNNSSSAQAFSIKSSQSASFLKHSQDNSEADFVAEDASEMDVTSEFHFMLRKWETTIDEQAVPAAGNHRYLSALVQPGDERQFKVLNSFSHDSSHEIVTATLRYQTPYFNFYVDNRDADSLSDDDIQELAENFADLVLLERDIFGQESDVNGDGRFDILATHVVNSLAGKGGIVTGFFYAMNLFESKKYPASNEREILYTLVPDPNGDYGRPVSRSFAVRNILSGVLPHEFQHMINFNQHYFINGGAPEKAFLNEGLAHLAEDLVALDTDDVMSGYGLENPSRVASYLSNIGNICFTCGASLSQRGGSYLFMKYLYEQAEQGNVPAASDGPDLIARLLDTSERGIRNIVSAAFGGGADMSLFKTLLGRFSLAVYLSNTGQTQDNRFNFFGIDLRAPAKDNRGTYLKGPAVQKISSFPFWGTLQGNGITYLQIPASLLANTTGEIRLESPGGSDFGVYLIQ